MNRRGFCTPVRDGDPDEAFLRRRLGVLDEDLEVAVAIEGAAVDELVLEILARAARIRVHDVVVREGGLGVFVQPLHVRVGRRGIEIEVTLLYVLAVVSFGIAQTKEPLLQDRIVTVPERDGETQSLLQVAKPGEPVFSPVVRTGARVIVRDVLPRVAVLAVVFAYRSPLPLAEVGP